MKEVFDYIDVLVDGKYIEALRSEELRFRGSSNQRIINVQTLDEYRDPAQLLEFSEKSNIITHC